jgi:UDP-galactopyranose mutase
MDELSHFKNAPPEMLQWERALLARANVVFTGGHSLYQAKKHLHDNIHPFPSSVDVAHFGKGRGPGADPLDQAHLERPRLGFFGVIDERMNLELVDGIAEQRPEWQVVLVGPVMKISPEDLPRRPNITYLGSKKYEELPSYLRHWDVALMPFALNESTRFISPTKTPEYLAAGKPVVSTSIRDVVRPYGERGLVRIADSVDGFVSAIESSLRQPRGPWLSEVDAFLSSMSWDVTFSRMRQELDSVSAPRRARRTTHPETAAF